MKGYSYPRRNIRRDEEILSLGQEIGGLKKRIGDIEDGVLKLGSLIQPAQEANQLPKSLDVVKNIEVSESPVQPTLRVDQLSRSLDVVKNLGNLKISESDSTYEKEEPLEMEEEMEMEA